MRCDVSYNIHSVVSHENISYDNHLHFVQSRGWICAFLVLKLDISAIYTGIKNPSFSHIPVFCWKLLGNYP